MISELFHAIKSTFHPQPLEFKIDERHYKVVPDENGLRIGELILPPVEPTLQLASLSGFRDAFQAAIDAFSEMSAVHVVDHETVALISLQADENGRRHEWLRATNREKNAFPFDQYQSAEMFLINLQRSFLPTEEIVQLQRLASSLTNESSIGTQDDGLTQTVNVKQGAVTRAEVNLPKRIKLLPYRTFREIDPVASEFLVRLKGEPGKLPSIALFEIDSSRWKHDTVLLVASWLRKTLPDAIVIA